ncbi:hypothetical protein [Paenibacillus cymbidii]|uniref:hypothetical protein n=1 Tax=Paenibacillus cymbidii TaxID=1639034 RepID=UPI001080EA89|nr:hypothetical protein [Paenibacillus cymbidii]
MNKNPLIAFLLSFIPGLGHLYWGRPIRAVLYGGGFFGPLALLLFAAIVNNLPPDDLAVFMLLVSLAFGVVNMLDMIVSLLSPGRGNGHGYRQRHAYASHVEQTDDLSAAVIAARMEEEDPHAAERLRAELDYRHHNERFFTIVLSFIPGLAHFQLGLMQRGLTFLLSFFGLFAMTVFVSYVTHVDGFFIFLLALPVIMFYGLFDAVQLQSRKQRGETLVDRTLFEDLDRTREDGRKSKIVALTLSIFPGAGHLYLGLQKRGLQLMAAFLLAIYLMDALRLTLFMFVIPILWFFSLFDAMQHVSRQEEEELKDVPLVNGLMNYQKWVGIALLALGAYYLLDGAVLRLIDQAYPEWRLSYWFDRYAQIIVVSVLFILGGLKLMLGSKSAKRGEESP